MPAWNRQPTVTKGGETRFSVGYTDERGAERTKGAFRSQRGEAGTNQWIAQYRVAEAQGRTALKDFLDREIRGVVPVVTAEATLDHVMAEWLYLSRPDAPDGLAQSTYESYLQVYRKHIRPLLGTLPIVEFAGPKPASRLRDGLKAAGVGGPTVTRALRVLSSMLSWATEEERLEGNGVMLLSSRNRSSTRPAKNALDGVEVDRPAGWALSPRAAARVVFELATAADQPAVLSDRDATAAVFLYLCGCRPQDMWAYRWGRVEGDRLTFREFLSAGELSPQGKVPKSLRTIEAPGIGGWLTRWKQLAADAGWDTSPNGFLFPGDAGAGHMTRNQTSSWARGPLRRAFLRAARSSEEFGHVAAGTPYSFRRGHISVRLRAGEDPAVVSDYCATSVQMLVLHYWRDIQDGDVRREPLGDQFAEAWQDVRAAAGQAVSQLGSTRSVGVTS